MCLRVFLACICIYVRVLAKKGSIPYNYLFIYSYVYLSFYSFIHSFIVYSLQTDCYFYLTVHIKRILLSPNSSSIISREKKGDMIITLDKNSQFLMQRFYPFEEYLPHPANDHDRYHYYNNHSNLFPRMCSFDRPIKSR